MTLNFVDIGILGYIVLYSLTLYNVSDEILQDWQTPEKDIKTIKKVFNIQKFIIYIFLCLDHKVPWDDVC